MTGKEYLDPNIWLKTSNQSTGTKEIILTIWYTKARKQKKINL